MRFIDHKIGFHSLESLKRREEEKGIEVKEIFAMVNISPGKMGIN